VHAGQRLFLSYLVLIALVVAALTLAAEAAVRRPLVDVLSADLRDELSLARALRAERTGLPPDSLADLLGALTGKRVTLVSRDGVVLGDSELDGAPLARMENHAARPEVRAALRGGTGRALRVSASVGTELLYVAVPATGGEVLRLAVPLREVDATVARVRRGILGVGAVALGLAVLFSLAFSVAVTRSLRRASAAARSMAAGDLSLRVPTGRPDELGELASALNTLAAELQRRIAQLEAERAETQGLLDAMEEGVVALGPDGTVRRANPAAQRLFSLSSDPRGLSPREISRRRPLLELVSQALSGTRAPPVEVAHERRRLLASGHPLPGGGAVLVFLDVSELRRLEEARRDFVANASHELKTPLTAIRGYSETLLDEALPPELRRSFAETVRANAERLQRIVDDLLDLSRLESGGWRADPEVLAVEEAAREAWAPFAEHAARKGVEFEVRLGPGCEMVYADPSGVRQIFTNLFSNALRYTHPEGRIEVSARCVQSPGEDRWIELSVRDTGAGIPSAHLPRIFERFYRVDAARSREEGGTGLGLSIVRHLVEAHGGRVGAESELGRGTTIRLTLPAPKVG
jgi:two-component system phosphate regulon sensor histidine kinase PhoR